MKHCRICNKTLYYVNISKYFCVDCMRDFRMIKSRKSSVDTMLYYLSMDAENILKDYIHMKRYAKKEYKKVIREIKFNKL